MAYLRSFLQVFVCILLTSNSYGQNVIQGNVIDSKTGEPLALVHITFNDNVQSGTLTDIDGRFFFESTDTIQTLTCSYVGYEITTIKLDSIENKDRLIVELKTSSYQLQEIVLKAGENPANRIVKKVIENKDVNNPENISSFKYRSYNKVIYDFQPNDSIDSDSTMIRINKNLKGGHLLISESVTERKFIRPDRNNEVIKGVKVSGFKHPSFAPMATDIQPFSFYDEIIKILDIDYLNPISNGSLRKYRFYIEQTLIDHQDTTFILSFEPRPQKNIEGLKGLLYINTNKFAIQGVIAEPYNKGLIDIKIQQKYQLLENGQWFPEQLNFEVLMPHYPSKKVGMSANGKSYIEDIELLAELNKKDFSLESIQMPKQAVEKDSLFWETHRAESLSEREITTYQVVDSLGKARNFDGFIYFLEKLVSGKIPIKFFDIDLAHTFVSNKFEGFRLGTGVYTNEKLSKFFSIGGFFGYGLKDHQWKYGGELTLTIDKQRELELKAAHQYTLRASGWTGLTDDNLEFRNFLSSQLDRIVQNKYSISFRTIKYAKLNLSISHAVVTPQFNYEYQTENQTITNYTYSDIGIQMKYAFQEKLINSLDRRISMGTKYPVLTIKYSKGINDFYSSQFEYNKIEARIEKSFLLKNLGKTSIRIDGGYVDRSLPYGLLFTGEGSFDNKLSFLVKNSFQTVTPNEFLSDQYVNLHFSHNFGSLLFHMNKFRPEFTVYHNIGWGSLSNPQNHNMIDFRTKEKGLYEAGLQIDKIIKLNYLNIGYLGFGAGTYFRYGPYSSTKPIDNIAFKLSMTLSTK